MKYILVGLSVKLLLLWSKSHVKLKARGQNTAQHLHLCGLQGLAKNIICTI